LKEGPQQRSSIIPKVGKLDRIRLIGSLLRSQSEPAALIALTP
jgi:hypothetical protein